MFNIVFSKSSPLGQILEKPCVQLPFPKQALIFTCVRHKSFEKTVGKGEMARNQQFLLFTQYFPPFWRTFCHFHTSEIVSCKLFHFGRF